MPDSAWPCRSCGSTDLTRILSLGATPVANALLTADQLSEPEPRFPLDLAFCPACSLVQLTDDLPPGQLFPEDYPYFSSFSDELIRHGRDHALELIESRRLDHRSLVVEVGSNDGYLLRSFAERGIPVLGIDPSPAQAAAAEAVGVPTLCEFFGADLAGRLRAEGRRADVIIASNVMAHVPDLNGFVGGLRTLVADDGVITVENPYVKDLIDECEFDTIYHEHLCYFSCTAVARLMRRHGLSLNGVDRFALHGGTLRWRIAPVEAVEPSAESYLRAEVETGLTEIGFYDAFAARVEDTTRDLVALLRGLAGDGQAVAAYGAAAKGSTLLNHAAIGPGLVRFVVDRNVHKQGLYMPGVHLPIHDPAKLLEEAPDFVLLLAWNFKEEIMREQEEFRRRGGRFIVPIPVPEVVDATDRG